MNKVQSEKEYQAPAIVYEGKITTRAGTPLNQTEPGDAFDPSGPFGSG